jgi:hypothetical protein
MCASIVLAALFSHPAAAELRSHVLVDRLGPESQDFPEEFRDIKFGEAVAIRNGIAFIGIPSAPDGGHVAVLNLTTNGWTRVDTLKAPASFAEAGFGRVLTFRDGVLVVGGVRGAYYFRRSNGVWTFRHRIGSPFFHSFAPAALRYEAGTLLASEFIGPCCPSAVHSYQLSENRRFFFHVQTMHASKPRAGDNFGADISMTDHSFVVGSPVGSRGRRSGLPTYDQTGAAYMFWRGADGQWRLNQKLVPSEPAPGFGTSVAIDRDMIIVGAPKLGIEGLPAGPATPDGHNAGGAAYVFVPAGARYVQALKLRPRPDELFQYQDFGYRVAMMGSIVAIAAVRPYGSDPGLFPSGLVVTYTRDGTSLLPRGIAKGHVVAASMGLANNWLLLGVPYEVSCPFGCVGSAHIYDVNRFAP